MSGSPSRRSELSRDDSRGAGQPAEDLDALAIVPDEFHSHEPLPGQEVETSDERLAGFDQVGTAAALSLPRLPRLWDSIDENPTHGYPAIEGSGLGLVTQLFSQ